MKMVPEIISRLLLRVLIDRARDIVPRYPKGPECALKHRRSLRVSTIILRSSKSAVQVEVLHGSNEASYEIYELTDANVDRGSARMQKTQKIHVCRLERICSALSTDSRNLGIHTMVSWLICFVS